LQNLQEENVPLGHEQSMVKQQKMVSFWERINLYPTNNHFKTDACATIYRTQRIYRSYYYLWIPKFTAGLW